jgi:hypothetical protein
LERHHREFVVANPLTHYAGQSWVRRHDPDEDFGSCSEKVMQHRMARIGWICNSRGGEGYVTLYGSEHWTCWLGCGTGRNDGGSGFLQDFFIVRCHGNRG